MIRKTCLIHYPNNNLRYTLFLSIHILLVPEGKSAKSSCRRELSETKNSHFWCFLGFLMMSAKLETQKQIFLPTSRFVIYRSNSCPSFIKIEWEEIFLGLSDPRMEPKTYSISGWIQNKAKVFSNFIPKKVANIRTHEPMIWGRDILITNQIGFIC